ncbi:hypothetical protein KAR34_11195 [bacterium]|nr:hypothetical protein [bacterium]
MLQKYEMLKKQIRVLIICEILLITSFRLGAASGERTFEEMRRGAMLGLAVGGFLGLYHYGLSKNMNPLHILDNSFCGLLAGTLVGVTLDTYELTSHRNFPGEHPLATTGIGALGGAFLGAFWALIPWALEDDEQEDETERRSNMDSNFYHGMIGLGIGGLSGAAIGFIVGMATLPASEENSARISTRIGIQQETEFINITSQTPAPQFCYRLVEIKY